ncbi:MFS transporter [Streptomyces erythrochromogenes]|uniref:MFS transporter n=1 Tax=Streptomyces erythrochromogenes TaxID=285574 RepID=UPI0033DEE09A
MTKGYAELLRLPGASTAAAPAALARLAGTMVPLSLLLATVHAGHSLAVAGSTGAGYALGGAVGGPVVGRLMDRTGPSRVLRVTAPLAALLLIAVALGAGTAPVPVLLGGAFAAGLTTAPVGASMRALWPHLTEDPALRQRAYSFEATLSETLFVLGPTAVTLFGALGDADSALLVAAALLGAGGLGFGQASAVRRRAGAGRHNGKGAPGAHAASAEAAGQAPARAAAVAVLVAIALTAALSTALAVAVTATLRDQGSPAEYAGTLVAVQSAGSVLGGLVYGARTWGGTTYRRYMRLLVVLTLALALLPLVRPAHAAGLDATWTAVLLGGLLLLSGLPMAPTGAEEFHLIGDMTAQEKATQAFAGVGSSIAVGGAAGSAAAGLVAERLGPTAALALPAAFTLAALLVSLAARGPILAAVTPPGPPGPATPPTPEHGEQLV